MRRKRLDATIPLHKTAAGRYDINVLNREKRTRQQARASSARAQSVAEEKGQAQAHGFQRGRVGAHRPG